MSDSPIKPKEARKIRAQFRQEEANKRTPLQQLARLNKNGHRAIKERARLDFFQEATNPWNKKGECLTLGEIKQLVVSESS